MEWNNILSVIGAFSIFAMTCLFGALLWEFAVDKIRDLKWAYKRKHRFDKPPTAACYCKDCRYYEVRDGYGKCRRGHIVERWNIADSWFCWQAVPLKRDPEVIKKEV